MVEFPSVPAGEPLVVSATVYTTYLKCPEQARARLAGTYPDESRESFRGMLAHRVFARHLAEGDVDGTGMVQVCREEIGRSLNPKLVALGLTPSKLESVVREVGDLFERFKRFPADGFQTAERLVEHEAAPGVTLRGRVDAVFVAEGDRIRIVDWKTGGLGAAEPQLDFYALLWTLDSGTPPATVEAASVTSGERYVAEPDPARLEQTAQAIGGLVAELRSAAAAGEELPRTAGPWCRYCPLLDSCEEGRAAVLPG
ncbi:MAG TPA: PD-(D/E)XK nuclease family protein [Acidimicrobiia bacterium]|nr:PD-(D/E)XK nuclease family protein [Acidimicrobiia bacterium]